MTFDDIPVGTALFLDSNTLVYHASHDPLFGAACSRLLTRIENGEFTGYISAQVLGEMAHRLMTVEARDLFGWPNRGIANRLKRHPLEVQRLGLYRRTIDEVKLIGINILGVAGLLVSEAADISAQYGILSNDALIVTVMRRTGLTHLASNDADFDRVPGITRYAPA
jgi:predicted nucleic acid-binding protein